MSQQAQQRRAATGTTATTSRSAAATAASNGSGATTRTRPLLAAAVVLAVAWTATRLTMERAAVEPGGVQRAHEESRYYNNSLVKSSDKIYSNIYLSPIVFEDYKLIFFPIAKSGSTTWKLLFLRMAGVQLTKESPVGDVHRVIQGRRNSLRRYNITHAKRKLKLLRHCNITYANRIMQDPAWTRAIFVRNPHARLLSAYLDKIVKNADLKLRRFSCHGRFSGPGPASFEAFVHALPSCSNPHWMPYSKYISKAEHWKSINFFGHMENLEQVNIFLFVLLCAYKTQSCSAKEEELTCVAYFPGTSCRTPNASC